MTNSQYFNRRKLILLALLLLPVILYWSAGVRVVRELLSLYYWRLRYIRLPRAVGAGPREIFQKTDPPNVGVNLVGISEEEWQVSYVWMPDRQSLIVSSKKAIITLGCWWDDAGSVTALPADSNGTFANAIDRKVGLSDAPVQTQVAYQAVAAFGRHVISPPQIGARGDGFFLVLEVEGIDASSPIRDRGQARLSHQKFGHGDPNSIRSIRVLTDSTAAQVGDLAVAIFAMDPVDNPDINIDLPEGWTSLGFNNVALQNIGYRACCRFVTEAGRQTATCKWTDDSTFVAEAALVVFKTVRSTSS